MAESAFLMGMQVFPSILAVQSTKRMEVVAMPIRKRRRNWSVRIHWEEVPAVFRMGNTLVVHPSIYKKMKKEFPSCP